MKNIIIVLFALLGFSGGLAGASAPSISIGEAEGTVRETFSGRIFEEHPERITVVVTAYGAQGKATFYFGRGRVESILYQFQDGSIEHRPLEVFRSIRTTLPKSGNSTASVRIGGVDLIDSGTLRGQIAENAIVYFATDAKYEYRLILSARDGASIERNGHVSFAISPKLENDLHGEAGE